MSFYIDKFSFTDKNTVIICKYGNMIRIKLMDNDKGIDIALDSDLAIELLTSLKSVVNDILPKDTAKVLNPFKDILDSFERGSHGL